MTLREAIKHLPRPSQLHTVMLFAINFELFPRECCAAYIDAMSEHDAKEALLFLLEQWSHKGEYGDPCSIEQAQASALARA